MCRRRWFVGGALTALLLGPGPPAARAAEPIIKEAVFPMKEVSVFEEAEKARLNKDPELHSALLGGVHAFCGSTPQKEVKKYPKLSSKRPLYGSVTFDADGDDPKAGVEYHFVVDESEPAAKKKPEPAAKQPRKRSLLKALVESLTGPSESSGPAVKRNFDRLIVDVNGDLDLTNDPVLGPMKDPPKALVPEGDVDESVRIFDYLEVPLDQGPGRGKRPLRLVSQLICYGPEDGALTLLAAAARKGKIRIGHEEYTAFLMQSDVITGRFDRPRTQLRLVSARGPAREGSGWWKNWLSTMRRVDGRLYRFSTTPSGDKLTVKPYDGDYGVLEIGPGNRKIKTLGVAGVLRAKQQFVVSVGLASFPVPLEKHARHELPVGDYQPIYLTADYGGVSLDLSTNPYPADGDKNQADKPPAYTIKIRKDKPCMLDFSGKPTVLFTSEAKGRTFRPGDDVPVVAALIEPKLGLMISGLEDRSQVAGKMDYQDEDGNPLSMPLYKSLDPTVVIKDSSGKQVAGGTMPFG